MHVYHSFLPVNVDGLKMIPLQRQFLLKLAKPVPSIQVYIRGLPPCTSVCNNFISLFSYMQITLALSSPVCNKHTKLLGLGRASPSQLFCTCICLSYLVFFHSLAAPARPVTETMWDAQLVYKVMFFIIAFTYIHVILRLSLSLALLLPPWLSFLWLVPLATLNGPPYCFIQHVFY